MTVIDELLQNATSYAESFDKADLALPPARRIAIVACMDARLNPHALLGLEEGDAHVIRNAGGVITDDAIRSLAISQRLLGTEEIMLIHHTDCGMLTFTDDELRRQIQDETGVKPAWAAEAFDDLEETCASPSRGSRRAPSSRGRTRFAGSSTRSRLAACARSGRSREELRLLQHRVRHGFDRAVHGASPRDRVLAEPHDVRVRDSLAAKVLDERDQRRPRLPDGDAVRAEPDLVCTGHFGFHGALTTVWPASSGWVSCTMKPLHSWKNGRPRCVQASRRQGDSSAREVSRARNAGLGPGRRQEWA